MSHVKHEYIQKNIQDEETVHVATICINMFSFFQQQAAIWIKLTPFFQFWKSVGRHLCWARFEPPPPWERIKSTQIRSSQMKPWDSSALTVTTEEVQNIPQKKKEEKKKKNLVYSHRNVDD